jgi:Protein of unknown function (DUF3047)
MNRLFVVTVLVAVIWSGTGLSENRSENTISLATFEAEPLKGFPANWESHGDKDEARKNYWIEQEENNKFLHARAGKHEIQIGLAREVAPQRFPRLRWRWRATQLPRGSDERSAATYYSAAGVYVLFDSRILPRIIKYVWSATLPVGSRLQNPFYWRGRTIVLRSGPSALGQWQQETVNFYQDYKDCFAREPGEVVGFGLLTSADLTMSEAEADYDDFALHPAEQ